MLGHITIYEETDGTFTAGRYCTRMQDTLYAFTPGGTSCGVTFPGRMLRETSENAVRDQLAKGVVWA